MNKETVLQNQIRLALGGLPGVLVLRNQVGKCKTPHGGWVTYGLGPGSPDLVCILAPHGRFVGLEVKTPKGRVREDQKQWASMVRQFGGRVYIVRSVQDALEAIENETNRK